MFQDIVMYLKIEVEYVFGVDKLYSFTDLPHEYCHGLFGQYEVITDNSFKQFTTLNTKIIA